MKPKLTVEEQLAAFEAKRQSKNVKTEAPDADGPLGDAVYSHDAMIQFIIDNPNWSHRKYARHFGQTASWFASVLAGDSFQDRLDLRREEINDPTITATLQERFRALTLRSIVVLQGLMDNPKVDSFVVVKAAEIGVKALGLGQGGPMGGADALPPVAESLDTLADRLTKLLESKGKGNGMIERLTPTDTIIIEELLPNDTIIQELKEVPDA